MTDTAEFARAHGYTGPHVCENCGATSNLHLLFWGCPETGEGGTSMECCTCGLAAGDPPDIHDECQPDEPEEPGGEPGPAVRVFHRENGWLLPDCSDFADCTTNYHRAQDGRPACTDAAVWKVVEEGTSADGFPMLTIGFYCDVDLPAANRQEAAA